MDILIFLALIVAIGALIYFNRSSRGLDVNNDGKVDLADVAAAGQNAVKGAKVAATKARATVKKTAAKAKTATKAAVKRRPK